MNTETNGIESEIFEYLYALRDSGIVNMWGAPPFLQERFGLTRNESRDYFFKWMDFVHAQATRDNPYSKKEST
jgi:hypothetical protein